MKPVTRTPLGLSLSVYCLTGIMLCLSTVCQAQFRNKRYRNNSNSFSIYHDNFRFGLAQYCIYPDKQKGMMNVRGEQFIPNKYDYLWWTDSTLFSPIIYHPDRHGDMGLYSREGKYRTAPVYDQLNVNALLEGFPFLPYRKGQYWGFIDRTGKEVTLPIYWHLTGTSDAGQIMFAKIKKQGKSKVRHFFIDQNLKRRKVPAASHYTYLPGTNPPLYQGSHSIKKTIKIEDTDIEYTEYEVRRFLVNQAGKLVLPSEGGNERYFYLHGHCYKLSVPPHQADSMTLYDQNLQQVAKLDQVYCIINERKVIRRVGEHFCLQDWQGNTIRQLDYLLPEDFSYNYSSLFRKKQGYPRFYHPQHFLRLFVQPNDSTRPQWTILDTNARIRIQAPDSNATIELAKNEINILAFWLRLANDSVLSYDMNFQPQALPPYQSLRDSRAYPGSPPFRNLAISEQGDQEGLIDKRGTVIMPPTVERIYGFNKTGKAIFRQNGRYGIMDTTGTILIPAVHDKIYAPFEAPYLVAKGEHWYYVNEANECVLNCPEE